jgi:hypothetical protein
MNECYAPFLLCFSLLPLLWLFTAPVIAEWEMEPEEGARRADPEYVQEDRWLRALFFIKSSRFPRPAMKGPRAAETSLKFARCLEPHVVHPVPNTRLMV